MKRIDLFITVVLIPLDYLTLLVAGWLAYALRFSPIFANIRPVTFDLNFTNYMSAVLPLALVWILVFAVAGLYATQRQRLATELTRVILAVSAGIAVVLAIAFFSRELFDSRFIVLAVWFISTVFVMFERFITRTIQKKLYTYGIGVNNIVIIGTTDTGKALKNYFDRYPRLGYAVSAHYANFNKETERRILELKETNKINTIFVVDPNFDRVTILRIKSFSDIEHLTFQYSAELFPSAAVVPIIHMFAGVPVIEVPKTPLDGWGAIYKRGFDIFFAALLIILSLPVQIPTVIFLLLEKQGGILYKQERVGQGGKTIKYFKFRSMIKDAHQLRSNPDFLKEHGNMRAGSPMFKLEKDPRVTKVGAFIRKFSIDEIPEFYLVLMGRMSLVGPRPHLPEEVQNYHPEQKKVLTIKPGITGLAQIIGRASLAFDEEVRLDMYYIENWSPWLDFIVLLKTPLVVLLQTGTGKKRL